MTSSSMHSCDESDDSLRITSVEVELILCSIELSLLVRLSTIFFVSHVTPWKKKKAVAILTTSRNNYLWTILTTWAKFR